MMKEEKVINDETEKLEIEKLKRKKEMFKKFLNAGFPLDLLIRIFR